MGDRLKNLKDAAHAIASKCGDIVTQSSVYQTAAWGNEAQPDFLNQVLLINTSLNAEDLLKSLLNIEQQMGRVRHQLNDPRTIDLDILFYNNDIINNSHLQIPHPRIHLRRFVLVPLNEIAPELLHPVSHKTIQQLLAQCSDALNVKKFSL